MAQGDVEVVRRFYDAYNARDAAAWSSLISDEFRFQSAFVGVEGRVYEGPSGFSRYFADLDFHLRSGKLVRLQTFMDPAVALGAVGLSE